MHLHCQVSFRNHPAETSLTTSSLSNQRTDEQLEHTCEQEFGVWGQCHAKVHRDKNRQPYAFIQYHVWPPMKSLYKPQLTLSRKLRTHVWLFATPRVWSSTVDESVLSMPMSIVSLASTCGFHDLLTNYKALFYSVVTPVAQLLMKKLATFSVASVPSKKHVQSRLQIRRSPTSQKVDG